MARLIIAVLAILAVIGLVATLGRAVTFAKEAPVPKNAKTISYILLILLMLGVVTGWLGGL